VMGKTREGKAEVKKSNRNQPIVFRSRGPTKKEVDLRGGKRPESHTQRSQRRQDEERRTGKWKKTQLGVRRSFVSKKKKTPLNSRREGNYRKREGKRGSDEVGREKVQSGFH